MAEKKPVYIRCPRCELNYIQKKDKLCSVCKNELSAKGEYVDELDLELCPVCKTNYIQSDEVMCASCLKERALDNEISGRTDDDDWDAYISRDEDEIVEPDEETGDMSVVNSIDEADLLEGDEDISFTDGLDDDENVDDDDDDTADDDDFDEAIDEDDDYDDEDDDDDDEDDDF